MGEALCYCGALETLVVSKMEVSDTAAAAVVAGLASCTSLKTLDLESVNPHGVARPVGAHVAAEAQPQYCRSLTALLGLSALTSLQKLNIYRCESLTALADLSALTSLKTLDLYECSSLTALPDLSALTSLQALNLTLCSSLTALPDLSALTRCRRSSSCLAPSRRTRPLGAYVAATSSWVATLVAAGQPHDAARPLGAQRRDAQPLYCSSLTALPDLSALTSLKTLNLRYCESLTALPDLSALTSLQTLDLRGCRSLTALPDLSALTDLKIAEDFQGEAACLTT